MWWFLMQVRTHGDDSLRLKIIHKFESDWGDNDKQEFKKWGEHVPPVPVEIPQCASHVPLTHAVWLL